MVTLQQIADLAHVSKCAASYAFSENPEKRGKLSEETRERILAVADRLNYRPCVAGRGLAMSRGYSLGLMLPKKNVWGFSPHAMGMFHGIAGAITNSDYILPLFFGWSDKLEQNIRQRRLDGVVVVARRLESPVFKKLSRLEVPVLSLNRRPWDEKCLSVRTDMDRWVNGCLVAFARRGYRRAVLYLRSPDTLSMDAELMRSFPELCARHGLASDMSLLPAFDGKVSKDTACLFRGRAPLLTQWFSEMPDARERTAVFSSPEWCVEAGYPLECCSYHDSHLLGETAVSLLLKAVEGREYKRELLLPCRKASLSEWGRSASTQEEF